MSYDENYFESRNILIELAMSFIAVVLVICLVFLLPLKWVATSMRRQAVDQEN